MTGLSEAGDESELRRLLEVVSKSGLKSLTLDELDRMRALLEAKDYGNNKKAARSKSKLLKQINSAIYDRHRPSRIL